MSQLYLRVSHANGTLSPAVVAESLASVAAELSSQAHQPQVASVGAWPVEVTLVVHDARAWQIENFAQKAVELSHSIAPGLTLSVVLSDSEKKSLTEAHPDQALLYIGDEHIVHVRPGEEDAIHAYCKLLLSAP